MVGRIMSLCWRCCKGEEYLFLFYQSYMQLDRVLLIILKAYRPQEQINQSVNIAPLPSCSLEGKFRGDYLKNLIRI